LIERKKAAPRQQIKDVQRVGFTVEPIGEGEYFGFCIDGDKLFLIEDFTVTHNTELSVDIALKAVKAGKRVYFFALEGEEAEIERRMKYKMMAGLYYATKGPEAKRINFQDWYYGELDLSEFEAQANDYVKRFSNLHTFYRTSAFGVDELINTYVLLKDKADLVVLDHLHYVDLDDETSNAKMKELCKALKDMTQITRVPCVAIAHLRKLQSDKRYKKALPDLSDFHGSSDITKICTKAILLAPAGYEDGKALTYIHAAKNRHGGERTKVVAEVKFDPSTNTYGDKCKFYAIRDGELEPTDVPAWYFKPGESYLKDDENV
jgi:hypothetical protein